MSYKCFLPLENTPTDQSIIHLLQTMHKIMPKMERKQIPAYLILAFLLIASQCCYTTAITLRAMKPGKQLSPHLAAYIIFAKLVSQEEMATANK